MTLSLHVCGSAGTHPGPGRACSGYLATTTSADTTTRVMLDCGNGSLSNLQRICDVADLDAVVITHLHPDHCVDLFGLYYALRFHPSGQRHISVYAPRGAAAFFRGVLGESAAPNFDEVCRFHEVAAGDEVALGGFSARFAAAAHPIETLATRLQATDGTVCYSADTHVSDAVVDAARDVDLFVCDASWLARGGPYPVGVHCTGEEAGQMAADAGAQRLLVTHVVPTNSSAEVAAEAARRYDGEIVIAEDGLEVDL